MLNVHNLSVSFAGSDLFSGITFKLNKGDRIGLIGKNGAGKSTLLKVISQDIEQAFTDISAKVSLLSDINSFVATSSEAQFVVNQRVTQNIDEIKKMVSDNVSGVQNTIDANREMALLVNNLNEEIRFFKI